jgi:hypothetical protein
MARLRGWQIYGQLSAAAVRRWRYDRRQGILLQRRRSTGCRPGCAVGMFERPRPKRGGYPSRGAEISGTRAGWPGRFCGHRAVSVSTRWTAEEASVPDPRRRLYYPIRKTAS